MPVGAPPEALLAFVLLLVLVLGLAGAVVVLSAGAAPRSGLDELHPDQPRAATSSTNRARVFRILISPLQQWVAPVSLPAG